ncbi:hypothetical protein SELMODRAFT_227279 [Selaginella moellendorffii]|uniref:O-methyltransferase domain-containing protein n=1 Tax=Selaginella moellendorffii TaxID=88036 RepID=D8QSC6_SELML|nr:caffeic acid 3-O-methyltransferase [Selaginella moellendorffii]EFJ36919.1 hypothetical protein SELMODRAFT_227279 [Selaginella moellendorffii]|eukprot:XP_002961659.1 caffeic acid 3-O-methyltransferase [Selaginella moellendorffii]
MEDESWMKLILINQGHFISSSLKALVKLKVPDILNKAAPSLLSPVEICDQLPLRSKATLDSSASQLGRLMRALAMFGVFQECPSSEGEQRYGLNAVSKHLVTEGNSESMVPSMMFFPKQYNVWDLLPDAILEGVQPGSKAHAGKSVFELDPAIVTVFNTVMSAYTRRTMRLALQVYDGFQHAKVIVDVGGSLGASLEIILAKYPNVKGINFDLPVVVEHAAKVQGMENVGGDMFVSVPQGDLMLLKWVLHDWSDEKAIKILENCRKSLAEGGKVVVIDALLPEVAEKSEEYSLADKNAVLYDLAMLTTGEAAKERTYKELEQVAMAAGFSSLSVRARVDSASIIEVYP